ncbi:MAG TPA: helix-turn-helix transcriptional regulator [Bosea sp. (in: a-proteobacteria)]|jgi:hypothetical protein|uniref:helix-turn-helix domain-containing protein n=1 Tax=Bosea sp. (in: a-proteobacteria) TaxID=1871050 RepID=UPI002E140DBE|nr:helix-turn-helix transcriptional regulator [Bosea sp. (in: a-proteobacteria)]
MAEKWKPSEEVRGRISQALNARGLNRQRLYKMVPGVSQSTIEKFMAGTGSQKTYMAILKALKIDDPDLLAPAGLASPEKGRYDRARVSGYEGSYTWIRPAFDNPAEICAFPVTMAWSDEKNCLVLRSGTEYDYSDEAIIHMPQHRSIHITNIEQGQCSLTIISYVNSKGHLFGLMLSLGWVGRGDNWSPMCVPVVFTQDPSLAIPTFGRFGPGQGHYERYAELLSRVKTDGYGEMLSAAGAA